MAREVARESGENLTQAIIHALEERLRRLRGRPTVKNLEEEIMTISKWRENKLPDPIVFPRVPWQVLPCTSKVVSCPSKYQRRSLKNFRRASKMER